MSPIETAGLTILVIGVLVFIAILVVLLLGAINTNDDNWKRPGVM